MKLIDSDMKTLHYRNRKVPRFPTESDAFNAENRINELARHCRIGRVVMKVPDWAVRMLGDADWQKRIVSARMWDGFTKGAV